MGSRDWTMLFLTCPAPYEKSKPPSWKLIVARQRFKEIDGSEAGAPKAHQEAVRTAGHDDNIRTIIFTGRPLRVRNNPYINNWEENRAAEIKELTGKGVIPVEHDFETLGDDIDDDTMDNARPFLMGKAAAVVNEKKSAKAVVDELVNDAVTWIHKGEKLIAKL